MVLCSCCLGLKRTLCLRLSHVQLPLGMSVPRWEIRSRLSGFSVFIWDSLLHVSLLKTNSGWTSIHLQIPRMVKIHMNTPFSRSLGVYWVWGAQLWCLLWFLSLLVNFR